MKRFFIWILFALLSATPMMAQQPQQPQRNQQARPQFNPEEFKKGLEAYIRERVGFTQAEADKVMPLYFEMKSKQMEINQSITRLKRSGIPGPHSSNMNYKDVVAQINSLNVELAKVEQNYYNKMCKIADAQKVLNLMLAEDAFHRDMLRRATPGFGGQGQNRGWGNGPRGNGSHHINWGGNRNANPQQNK